MDGPYSVPAGSVGGQCRCRAVLGVVDLVVRAGLLFRDLSVGSHAGRGRMVQQKKEKESLLILSGKIVVTLWRFGSVYCGSYCRNRLGGCFVGPV